MTPYKKLNQTKKNAIFYAQEFKLEYRFELAFDIRLALQSLVRIAQEHNAKVLLLKSIVVWLVITLKCSVSISFDAIVYDRHKPIETLVPSYFHSREDRQFQGNLKKKCKFYKKISIYLKKTLILFKMRKLSISDSNKALQTKTIFLNL